MLGTVGISEIIKIQVQPFVDSLMQGPVLRDDLLGMDPLLHCLHLGGCSILVGSADVCDIIAFGTAVSAVDISAQDRSNDVSQMWLVVHVRKCCCYKFFRHMGKIFFIFKWQSELLNII
ncbi:hypothetical protein ENBRE01_2325 [Enteropsectra breve]|nr:hypothetical protein ENBRE01_2325 [Enteropsectra breve]